MLGSPHASARCHSLLAPGQARVRDVYILNFLNLKQQNAVVLRGLPLGVQNVVVLIAPVDLMDAFFSTDATVSKQSRQPSFMTVPNSHERVYK